MMDGNERTSVDSWNWLGSGNADPPCSADEGDPALIIKKTLRHLRRLL